MTLFQGKPAFTSLPVTLAGDSSSHRATDALRFKAPQLRRKEVRAREERKAKSKVLVGSKMNIYVQIFVPK